jgi:DNA-directed RNA polymerase specialized sigma24 family protein
MRRPHDPDMSDNHVLDAPTRHTTRSPRSSRSATARPGHELQHRLRNEWERLARRPELVADARSWRVTDATFDHLDELLTLAGHDVMGDPRCDLVLRRLVELARSDVLAARVVLQRLVPGMLARVRTHHRRGDRTDIFEELVGAAWITIREFDPRRQPSCLAAALLAGAEYRAFGRDRRRRPNEPRAIDALSFDERPLEVRPSPCDELAELVRQTRADGATDEELAVVAGLIEADSPGELARSLGVTARTVRNRRDRITERMRRVALAA